MLPTDGITKATEVPKILEGAKLAFVLALRAAFKSSLTNKDLLYSDDPKQTKIKIYTATPRQLEFYPNLVVSTGGGDVSMKYLQDDFVDESGDTLDYAGQVSFTISLTVQSKSTLEREKLIDHLIFFIRHIFVDTFRRVRSTNFNFDLMYTKDIRIGAENITEVENTPLYEQTIDIPCYMEYHAVIDQSALATIKEINIGDIQLLASEDNG